MKEIIIGEWIWKKFKDSRSCYIRIPKDILNNLPLEKANYLIKLYKLESES